MTDRITFDKYRGIIIDEVDNGTFRLLCFDFEGREYLHYFPFRSRSQAVFLKEKVEIEGTIDSAYWDCRVPYGSDAWDNDGMEVTLMDDQERAHKGYHYA